MATESQELTASQNGNGRVAATDYPKVESFETDVQHYRPGAPIGSIPLSVPESALPHHPGANPMARTEPKSE